MLAQFGTTKLVLEERFMYDNRWDLAPTAEAVPERDAVVDACIQDILDNKDLSNYEDLVFRVDDDYYGPLYCISSYSYAHHRKQFPKISLLYLLWVVKTSVPAKKAYILRCELDEIVRLAKNRKIHQDCLLQVYNQFVIEFNRRLDRYFSVLEMLTGMIVNIKGKFCKDEQVLQQIDQALRSKKGFAAPEGPHGEAVDKFLTDCIVSNIPLPSDMREKAWALLKCCFSGDSSTDSLNKVKFLQCLRLQYLHICIIRTDFMAYGRKRHWQPRGPMALVGAIARCNQIRKLIPPQLIVTRAQEGHYFHPRSKKYHLGRLLGQLLFQKLAREELNVVAWKITSKIRKDVSYFEKDTQLQSLDLGDLDTLLPMPIEEWKKYELRHLRNIELKYVKHTYKEPQTRIEELLRTYLIVEPSDMAASLGSCIKISELLDNYDTDYRNPVHCPDDNRYFDYRVEMYLADPRFMSPAYKFFQSHMKYCKGVSMLLQLATRCKAHKFVEKIRDNYFVIIRQVLQATLYQWWMTTGRHNTVKNKLTLHRDQIRELMTVAWNIAKGLHPTTADKFLCDLWDALTSKQFIKQVYPNKTFCESLPDSRFRFLVLLSVVRIRERVHSGRGKSLEDIKASRELWQRKGILLKDRRHILAILDQKTVYTFVSEITSDSSRSNSKIYIRNIKALLKLAPKLTWQALSAGAMKDVLSDLENNTEFCRQHRLAQLVKELEDLHRKMNDLLQHKFRSHVSSRNLKLLKAYLTAEPSDMAASLGSCKNISHLLDGYYYDGTRSANPGYMLYLRGVSMLLQLATRCKARKFVETIRNNYFVIIMRRLEAGLQQWWNRGIRCREGDSDSGVTIAPNINKKAVWVVIAIAWNIAKGVYTTMPDNFLDCLWRKIMNREFIKKACPNKTFCESLSLLHPIILDLFLVAPGVSPHGRRMSPKDAEYIQATFDQKTVDMLVGEITRGIHRSNPQIYIRNIKASFGLATMLKWQALSAMEDILPDLEKKMEVYRHGKLWQEFAELHGDMDDLLQHKYREAKALEEVLNPSPLVVLPRGAPASSICTGRPVRGMGKRKPKKKKGYAPVHADLTLTGKKRKHNILQQVVFQSTTKRRKDVAK